MSALRAVTAAPVCPVTLFTTLTGVEFTAVTAAPVCPLTLFTTLTEVEFTPVTHVAADAENTKAALRLTTLATVSGSPERTMRMFLQQDHLQIPSTRAFCKSIPTIATMDEAPTQKYLATVFFWTHCCERYVNDHLQEARIARFCRLNHTMTVAFSFNGKI